MWVGSTGGKAQKNGRCHGRRTKHAMAETADTVRHNWRTREPQKMIWPLKMEPYYRVSGATYLVKYVSLGVIAMGEATVIERRPHEKINGHRELIVSSRRPWWSRLRGPMITAQSRLGEVTAQSRQGHSSVTARSQLNHGIFSMITARFQLNHGPGYGSVTAGCDHFDHGELTVISHGGQFFFSWGTKSPCHWRRGPNHYLGWTNGDKSSSLQCGIHHWKCSRGL